MQPHAVVLQHMLKREASEQHAMHDWKRPAGHNRVSAVHQEKYTNMLLGVADSPEATSGDIPADALHRMTPEQRAQLERLRTAVTAP